MQAAIKSYSDSSTTAVEMEAVGYDGGFTTATIVAVAGTITLPLEVSVVCLYGNVCVCVYE